MAKHHVDSLVHDLRRLANAYTAEATALHAFAVSVEDAAREDIAGTAFEGSCLDSNVMDKVFSAFNTSNKVSTAESAIRNAVAAVRGRD